MNYFYPTSSLFFLFGQIFFKKIILTNDAKNHVELTTCFIKFHFLVWTLCFSLLQSKL